jgi:O-antigen ligase
VLTATADIAVRRSSPSMLDCVIFYGVFALLLFGPLAFGAVEAWSIFVLEAGASLLLMLWIVRQATSGELSAFGNGLFAPMLAFALCVGLQLATGHTAYRYESSSAGLLYCAYGILCFLVIQVLRRTAHVRVVTIIFTIYGFALASLALLQNLTSTSRLYWLRTPSSGGWIYGPYVNHNHYAGLMEMLLPVPLVYSLTRGARGQRKSMALAAAGLMAVTIFLSGSRGGMLAFGMQVVMLAAILISQRERQRPMTVALTIILAVGVGVLAWLGGGANLGERLTSIRSEARIELSGGTRIDIDRDALKMFGRKPLLGWGLAVFPDVYPQFRSFHTNFFINEAHNDYLQLLVETGGLGFVTMLWLVWVVYRNGARKLGDWIQETNGAVALAAMLGVTGILVHSLLDFNLQIPANAALFYVLCVAAAMEPCFGMSRRKRSHEGTVASEGLTQATQVG